MKKRILCLLMCVVLLLPSSVLLSSCSKDRGGIEISRKAIDVNLSDYSIVRGTELTQDGVQHVFDFAQNLSALTAVNMSVQTDIQTGEIQNQAPEILIGKTHRIESITSGNEIENVGWTIRVFKKTNKIVILGTTPYLTRVALSWFERTYLNALQSGTSVLSVNKEVKMSNMSTVSLVQTYDGIEEGFTVVCEKGKDELDVPYQIGKQACDLLWEKARVSALFVPSDSNVQKQELLVGNMSRPDVKAEMAKIEANEFAVSVQNEKIYLVAWSDEVLPSAYELFLDVMAGSAVVDASGNTVYQIPSDSMLVQSYGGDWITDFPKPVGEGISPEAAVDVGDGCLQYIYSGSGVTREAFVAYCESLKSAGFTPLGNEDVQWEGSSHRTFLHEQRGVSLHVSHMAFSHAGEQGVADMVNSIRIVSGSTNWGGRLTDTKHFRPQIAGTEAQVARGEADYVKITNSQITSNAIDHKAEGNWGLGQIITLADGSFILIDGGRSRGKNEVKNLWQILNAMYKRAHDGSDPTAEKPIHIRAWIITHEHGDHHNLLRNFCNTYGPDPALKFDYLLANFGSGTQLRAPSAAPTASLRNNMKAYQDKVLNGFEFIQVNTGQVFYFANCRLEILVTVDDLYPWRCSEQNNASLIVRTALYENDGVNSHETTSLWLGDAEVQASRVARALYGGFLQSEQVQISHHGNWGGSEKRLYELVGACEVIWYPGAVKQSALNNCMDDAWSYSPAFKNPKCKLLIFNGSNISGIPVYNVTLTVTATGPLYNQLYDAISGNAIEAKGVLWPVIDVQAYCAAAER